MSFLSKLLTKLSSKSNFLVDTAGNEDSSKQLERTVACKHCDMDAYYKLTIEYFNESEVLAKYLCVKCVKIESKKVIDDFPSVKSLKVEPIIHPTILTI
jgi:hypothetical protein